MSTRGAAHEDHLHQLVETNVATYLERPGAARLTRTQSPAQSTLRPNVENDHGVDDWRTCGADGGNEQNLRRVQMLVR